MKIKVEKLKKETVDDFFKIHCKEPDGWCNCVAWWVPTWEGWGERTAEENLALRKELFSRGEYDGYILYVEDQVAGWCQCGPRDRLSKLCKQFDLPPNSDTWAITCLIIKPPFKKRGLSHIFLAKILDDLKEKNIRYVESFPKRGEKLDDGHVWTGPETIYQRAGFKVVRDNETAPVYRLRLGGK